MSCPRGKLHFICPLIKSGGILIHFLFQAIYKAKISTESFVDISVSSRCVLKKGKWRLPLIGVRLFTAAGWKKGADTFSCVSVRVACSGCFSTGSWYWKEPPVRPVLDRKSVV